MSRPDATPRFSICTLVTDGTQHGAMRASFAALGFDAPVAEFLTVDNTRGNRRCAYAGLREMLLAARGEHAILCHQDVRLLEHDARTLADRLAALTARDPDWAVAGNAGATEDGELRLRISDPHGEDRHIGPLPARAASLDENFLIVRRETGILPSPDLRGFHLYGTDLCLQARCAGRTAWVVDFHLRHLSAGRVDRAFLAEQAAFERRWGRRLGRAERIRTTCTKLTLRAGLVSEVVASLRLARRRARLAT
ncbi:hypothetical protein [Falsiroseomonas oryziterrae]|uniref:hypothetical protein n=1 Tax=Falsiroseomonas oryziterrae TaxID=2911368 RepID=UPI001F37128A|nr:hypothetical protein [Roseomonas sp. NPKOSM-4]